MCERPVSNGCWILVMNLSPVNQEEPFLTGIFLLRVHSFILITGGGIIIPSFTGEVAEAQIK